MKKVIISMGLGLLLCSCVVKERVSVQPNTLSLGVHPSRPHYYYQDYRYDNRTKTYVLIYKKRHK